MNGEDDTFNIITSLKIVSMIREGQKVSIRNGTIHMDRTSEGMYSAARRWYYQDSRYKTYNYIKNLVLSAVAIYKNLEEECEDKEIL